LEVGVLDKTHILEKLSLPPTTPIILTHLDLVLWGQGLYFHALAHSIPFELRFVDCREVRWQLYTHMQHSTALPFPATELANLRVGRSQQRSPAQLLTEHFGLTLFYGSLQLVHAGQVLMIGEHP
jgi:hypothetical protein